MMIEVGETIITIGHLDMMITVMGDPRTAMTNPGEDIETHRPHMREGRELTETITHPEGAVMIMTIVAFKNVISSLTELDCRRRRVDR
jgi:hypothetical protein